MVLPHLPPRILVALAPLCWAGNVVTGRAVAGAIHPVDLAYFRWAVALAVLLTFVGPRLWAKRAVLRAHAGILIALGVSGFAAFHTVLYVALTHTTATNVALLHATIPLLIAALAFLAFGERLRRWQIIGLALSMCGVVLVIARGDLDVLLGLRFNFGDVLAFISAVLWSIYSVLLKRRPPELTGVELLGATALAAFVVLTPIFILFTPGPSAWLSFTPGVILGILYVALVASLLATVVWNLGVRELGPATAGLYLPLQPAATALLGVTFLAEPLYSYHIVGALLVVGGLWLGARRERPAPARAA